MSTSHSRQHPILDELNLLLPLLPDVSWTMSRMAGGPGGPRMYLTLTDTGDLVIELHPGQHAMGRYVFDARGRLVSWQEDQPEEQPYARLVRGSVLNEIRKFLKEAEHDGNAST